MKVKQTFPFILTVALALGTGWAVRGKFGHEQGAAWAGAIGAVSVVLASGRKDWYAKAFAIAMAGAVGWGMTGVISYGEVVGYGRADDFGNAFYGLSMLFVIGGLFGFLGGGFVGLALLDSETRRIKWASLLAEMIGIGLLTYGLLINQLGWLMTPPRSEMWAACFGASIALGWYLVREGYTAPLRVAVWSALGAGWGFAFGNFLQVVGISTGGGFNYWNVMEYSIGFCGGAGMAYGISTSSWPVSHARPSQWLLLLFVVVFVPFVVWQQSFVTERFDFIVRDGDFAGVATIMKTIAISAIAVVALITIRYQYTTLRNGDSWGATSLKTFFVLYTALYILLSFQVTGLFVHPPEQYLYIVNLLAIVYLLRRSYSFVDHSEKPTTWGVAFVLCVIVIALLALIAIHAHPALPGANERFGD